MNCFINNGNGYQPIKRADNSGILGGRAAKNRGYKNELGNQRVSEKGA